MARTLQQGQGEVAVGQRGDAEPCVGDCSAQSGYARASAWTELFKGRHDAAANDNITSAHPSRSQITRAGRAVAAGETLFR